MRYRHKKRGTEYELIGIGKMQSHTWEEPINDAVGYIAAPPIRLKFGFVLGRSLRTGALSA